MARTATLPNGERWERLASGVWVGAGEHRRDYSPIHGDSTFASYARSIAAGERVRRQGGVRIRFEPPLGRFRRKLTGHAAKPHRHGHARAG